MFVCTTPITVKMNSDLQDNYKLFFYSGALFFFHSESEEDRPRASNSTNYRQRDCRHIAKDKMSPQTCITKSEGHLPVPTHQRLIAIIMYVETGLQSAEMQGTDKLAAALTKQNKYRLSPQQSTSRSESDDRRGGRDSRDNNDNRNRSRRDCR